MTRQELKNVILSLENESKLTFSTGDQILSNHFDHLDENRIEKGDTSTAISYLIYAWISASIIFKAQGKENSKKGYSYFESHFENIVKNQKEEIKNESEVEKENALLTLDQFFNHTKTVRIEEMISKFAPLAVLKLLGEHQEEGKEILKEFHKKKEIIFNQVVLFSRSLFHTFLSKDSIDALKIRLDYHNLDNGIFLYEETTLIIPTWQNAFTLSAFKQVLVDGMDTLSNNFPLSKVNTFAVIYFAKDIYTEYKF